MFGRLIVVSNLVGIPSRHDTAQADGLVVAMRAVLKRHSGIWFGWSGSVASGELGPTRPCRHAGVSYIVTDLTQEDHDEYYNGFANRVCGRYCTIDLTSQNIHAAILPVICG